MYRVMEAVLLGWKGLRGGLREGFQEEGGS